MLSKLQEFVDNMKRFLDQKTTSSIAAPAPTETAPPPPRTAVPNISAVEDNSRIEAGPTKKGAMAAALAMTLQRLNNVQAANDATARNVAIRQSDREAAAEAHRIESAARLADEKNLLNFKETLPSNMDARATNKAYREAMTRNANLGADLKQARLSGTMPTAGRGGKSGGDTSTPPAESITSRLTPEQKAILDSLKTKPQKDKYLLSIVAPDVLKDQKKSLDVENAKLSKQLKEAQLKNDPVKTAVLNQQLVENEAKINEMNMLTGSVNQTPEELKNKYNPTATAPPPAPAQTPQPAPTAAPESTIEFTGETDPVKGKRVRNKTTGQMGWMK